MPIWALIGCIVVVVLLLVVLQLTGSDWAAGAVVLPASPGFYHGPKDIDDLVNFVVGRICDQLGVEHALMKRWAT